MVLMTVLINKDMAKRANIPNEALSEPKVILGLDGNVLPKVTHHTTPLTLITSGNRLTNITSKNKYSRCKPSQATTLTPDLLPTQPLECIPSDLDLSRR